MNKKDIEKRNWSLEDWKNSKDKLDRLVWFISIQSPHNLWRARQSLSKIEKEARKELIEFILVADSLELLKKNMTKLKKAGE